jgi:hypothetical protein
MATIHHLPVRTPQPPPPATSGEASLLSLVYRMGEAEGERRVYAKLGIPQPPFSPSLEERLTDSGVAAILAASGPSS